MHIAAQTIHTVQNSVVSQTTQTPCVPEKPVLYRNQPRAVTQIKGSKWKKTSTPANRKLHSKSSTVVTPAQNVVIRRTLEGQVGAGAKSSPSGFHQAIKTWTVLTSSRDRVRN